MSQSESPARALGEYATSPFELGELERFRRLGYAIFPAFFSESWNKRFVEVLDNPSRRRRHLKALLPHPLLNEVIFDPALLSVVRSVLGESFLFHHANGRALPHTDPGKPWHHDYDGAKPWVVGSPMMIHLMGYPAGIDDAIGPLVLRPGSHHSAVERAYPSRFGFDLLPEEIAVTGCPGLLVVLNSAIWHVRRPNQTERTRYYFNLSYCQFGVARPERAQYGGMLRHVRKALKSASAADAGLIRMLTQADTLICGSAA